MSKHKKMDKGRELIGRIVLAVLLLLTVMACGKENEQEEPVVTAGKVGLTLQLRSPLSLDVETTRANATIGDVTVSDVWVIQFTQEESVKVVIKNYTEIAVKTDLNFFTITTGNTDFWNVNSQFYIITNAGSDHAGLQALQTAVGNGTPVTAAEVMGQLKELTESAATTEPGILSAGPIDFEQKTGGNPQTSVALLAHMKRAYSRITVQYATGSEPFPDAGFTPSKLTVKEVPKKIAFFERAGATSGTFPSIAESDYTANFTESVQLYPATGGSAVEFSDISPFIFYMPANLRGTGISTTAQGKNVAANGPLEDSTGSSSGTRSLKGCTCIVLEGKYKYDKGQSGEVGVTYTFYLGGNLVNNYNLERGKAYTLKINIASVNSADLRVTVTDGNVSVFDQVTVVPEINVEI